MKRLCGGYKWTLYTFGGKELSVFGKMLGFQLCVPCFLYLLLRGCVCRGLGRGDHD
jgi:hypothetical protein